LNKYIDNPMPLSASVSIYNGRPTLFINEHPEYPMIYALTDCPGGRWSWEEVPAWNIANFSSKGFRLFQVSIWLEHLWKEDDTISIDLVRRQIRGIVDICPKAAIFIRLHINSPMWWNSKHPEECTQYANGPLEEENMPGLRRLIDRDLDRVPRHSMASIKWRMETTGIIKELMKQLSATPEGDYLVGIHMASGVSHEWHYWGFIENEPDTSLPMTIYFRKWLKQKYQTDKNLQKAWNNCDVTFENAQVPGMKDREETTDGIFRDPGREMHVCDYYECQQQSIADNIMHFCRIAKENWPRPIVTGVFYGYFFSMFGRQTAGGHLQVEKILNCKYVDYLSAPMSYCINHRKMGGSGQSRGIIESCLLHGKLWLDEMDQGTFMDIVRKEWAHSINPTLEDSVAIIRRNVAESFTRGMGLWFYDFGPTDKSGWWDHPVLMQEIGKIKKLFEQYYEKEFRPQADVLLVYDTNSFYYLANNASTDPVTDPVAVNITSADAYRSGVALDMVYLCDLERADLQRYRVVVFVNTYYLTPKQKEFIKTMVAADGRHLVWMCAPGYTDGESNNPDNVSDVTGINLISVEEDVVPMLDIRERMLLGKGFHDEPECLDINHQFVETGLGDLKPFRPLFAIDDSQTTVFGFIKGTSYGALGVKKLNGWTSWYCSVPLVGPSLMRYIFKCAGAHIYNENGDVVYSGSGILSVHTLQGGTRRLKLKNGKDFVVQLPPRSTTYFDSDTGELLLK